MLTRRLLLGSAAAMPLIWNNAFAETLRDSAVMAARLDDIISLDPAESFEFSSNEIGSNVYETLVAPDAADPAKIVGVLADHWEIAGDAKTYTFHLKQDRKFSSGNLVTADDAAWSLQRAATMNKAPGFIINQLGLTKDTAAAHIKATDDHTLVIQVSEAFAPDFLFYCLSANVGSIVEKKLALSHAEGDDLGNGWLRAASAGSNAWVVRSWKPGDGVMLDASPNSTGKLKHMVIRHVAEPAAQLLLLQKGEADIARNLVHEQLAAIKGKPEFQVASKSMGVLNYIALNQGMAELAHPDVPQAIKWAIDYDAIAGTIAPDTLETHQAFLPAGFSGASTDNPFHQDVGKARGLMKQAGLEAGFSVTLDHQAAAPFSAVAKAIQADLDAIGIKVTLVPGDARQVIDKTRARQHQMAMLLWGSDYLDPHSNAQTFCVNEDNGDKALNRTVAWRSKWEDKDLTGRTEDALKEIDAGKRSALYKQLQKDFAERAPFVILQQQVSVVAMRKGLSGFELGILPDGTRYTSLAKA